MAPTPAARLAPPSVVWTESGCNETPPLPPTSAFAPTPTPSVADAVPPVYSPDKAPGPTGPPSDTTSQVSLLGPCEPDVETETADRADIVLMLGTVRRSEFAVQGATRRDDEADAPGHVAIELADGAGDRGLRSQRQGCTAKSGAAERRQSRSDGEFRHGFPPDLAPRQGKGRRLRQPRPSLTPTRLPAGRRPAPRHANGEVATLIPVSLLPVASSAQSWP